MGLLNHRERLLVQIYRVFRHMGSQFKEQFKISKSTNLILYPDSRQQIFLDMFLMIAFFVLIIFLPVRVAFKDDIQGDEIVISEVCLYISVSVMIIQIIASSITGYYKKGQLIERKRDILKMYYKSGQLMLDCSILTLFLLSSQLGIVYLELPLLLKTRKISKILHQIEENFQFQQKILATMKLCKLALQIFLIAHICGCAFYLSHVIETENDSESTWIKRLGLTNAEFGEQYIASLYWSVVTMVTLGYGDIVPVTQSERILVVIFTLFSSGLFGYTINHIGTILQKLEEQNKDQIREVSLITTYLRQRNIEHSLLMKCRRYLQYLANANDKSEECETILEKLGHDLQTQVKRDIYSKIILSHKFFSLNFSQNTLIELSDLMVEQKYGPDDIVFREDQLNDRIFFVMRGNLVVKKRVTEIAKLNQGMIFGQQSFLTTQPEQTTVICKNVVTVAYLKREDFLLVLRKFSVDYQKFCDLKDNFIINQNADGLDLNCLACESFKHDIAYCPLVTFVPNQQRQLFYDKDIKELQRKIFLRRRFRSINPIRYIDYLHESAADFLYDAEFYEDFDEKQQHLDRIDSIRVKDKELSERVQYSLDRVFSDGEQSIELPKPVFDEDISDEGIIEEIQQSLKKKILSEQIQAPPRSDVITFPMTVPQKQDEYLRKNMPRKVSEQEFSSEKYMESDSSCSRPETFQEIQSPTSPSLNGQMETEFQKKFNQLRKNRISNILIPKRQNLCLSPENEDLDDKDPNYLARRNSKSPYPRNERQKLSFKKQRLSQINEIQLSHFEPGVSIELKVQEKGTEEKNVSQEIDNEGKYNAKSIYPFFSIKPSFNIDQQFYWKIYKPQHNLEQVLKVMEIVKRLDIMQLQQSVIKGEESKTKFLKSRFKISKIKKKLLEEEQNSHDNDAKDGIRSINQSGAFEKRNRHKKLKTNVDNLDIVSIYSMNKSQNNDDFVIYPQSMQQSASGYDSSNSNPNIKNNFDINSNLFLPASEQRSIVDSQSPQNFNRSSLHGNYSFDENKMNNLLKKD